VALVVAVYFALQVLATTIRLVLLGLAALVAISAYRAWSGERRDRTPTPAPRRR